MRYSVMALVGGAALGGLAIAGFRLHSQAAAETGAVVAVETFQLQASGDAATCLVEKAAGPGPLAHVIVAPDCDSVMPGLSTMRYWRESADGTVTLSADGKTALVLFGPSDGVAYESVEPRTPLMALIASN
jgi:hypothetical protein